MSFEICKHSYPVLFCDGMRWYGVPASFSCCR